MKKVLSKVLGASSVAATTLTLAAATMTSAEAGSFTKRAIDFDSGITHPAGTMIQGNEWSQWGVEVSALNGKSLTIFDSNCEGSACSGGDNDLGTAYLDDLGDENRGNVLIIQENNTDNDGDGLYDNPDDDDDGGIISFDFSAALQGLDKGFTIDNLEFIDYDLGETRDKLFLTAYGKDDSVIGNYDIVDFGTRIHNPNSNGDNSVWKFDFDQLSAGALEDVWKLDVNYNGISGAISKIEFQQYMEEKPKAYVPEPSAVVGLAFLGGGMFLSRRRKSS